ncbi:hypothetical protein FHS20_001107 [Phyllobacterium endophyticum]|nr:hypothetical protein [Phyllobacterium endophyticum]
MLALYFRLPRGLSANRCHGAFTYHPAKRPLVRYAVSDNPTSPSPEMRHNASAPYCGSLATLLFW